MKTILFIDIEVTAQKKIESIWAIDQHWKLVYSWKDVEDFYKKAKDYDVLAWHNIIHHDLEFLAKYLPAEFIQKPVIDTLWLSSLIFIRKPYHKLIKEYKKPIDPEYEDELDSFFMRHVPDSDYDNSLVENNPVKDAGYSLKVFENCVEEFKNIPDSSQQILYSLLYNKKQFYAFFQYLEENKLFKDKDIDLEREVRKILEPKVLRNEFFDEEFIKILELEPLSFAYIFRLIEQNLNRDLSVTPDCSILPFWILHKLENINKVFAKIFKYKKFDAKTELRSWWKWFKDFRTYEHTYIDENWKEVKEIIKQEDIVNAWFNWEDFIAVLATWWGKSLCFQLPALAKAENSGFLTLVISPLQSLMEDQVSNLKYSYHKTNVGALHSALDPLTKKEVCDKVEHWGIDLLYLSPEMLRSPSTQSLLAKRHIDRLVIDEAHCFSKWWHDFRIDYMFIADFIKELWKLNNSIKDISVSCFTATAKQEVIDEIKTYFKNHFNKDLKEFISSAKRDNLHYEAYNVQDEKKKFGKLIEILEDRVDNQPCIIFTRYTGKNKTVGAQNLTQDINDKLLQDWYWNIKAAFFHWQLEWAKKSEMMNKFMSWEVNVIVATNAFWMWVDKKDVRYVIHYDMPASLENYLQEAWRAWRDWKDSQCIILYTPDDLDSNLQLNQWSQLKKREIQSLLKYIRTQFQLKWKNSLMKSAKEFVKYSGWISWDFEDEYWKNKQTWETKVKTALWFLEKPLPKEKDSWFIERKFNKTRVFATAKWAKFYNTKARDTDEEDINTVFSLLDHLDELDDDERRIIKDIYRHIRTWKVMSIEDLPNKVWRHIRRVISAEGTRAKKWIEELVDILREQNLIDKDDEISLSLNVTWRQSSLKRLVNVKNIVTEIFNIISEEYWDYITEWSGIQFSRKAINTELVKRLWDTNYMDKIDHLFHILNNRWYINISWDEMVNYRPFYEVKKEIISELDIWNIIVEMLLDENVSNNQKDKEWIPVDVNIKILTQELNQKISESVTPIQLENILKLLHEFDIIWVESWLFLYFTRFDIWWWKHLKSIGEDWKEKYTQLNEKHFETLSDFYKNKTQQAHIMDEFARKIIEYLPLGENTVQNYVNQFVEDYFTLDYEEEFLPKYFKWRLKEISRSTSKAKHDEIWNVSDEQKEILESKNNLLVIAGPWSGKTKSLVHKVADLVLEEWVSKDEFLLLTFMRSAKYELKNRIIKLIWNQWYLLNIHTFHGFAYELLEKNPLKEDYANNDNDENRDKIIKEAIKYLEESKDLQLPYRVIMVDEFQDIWETYFKFIEAISAKSSFDENKIRIIATWDDDQSIMEFNGADIWYIQNFKEDHNADSVILSKNFRSTQEIVDYTTTFVEKIKNRLKKWTKLTSWRVVDIFQGASKIETWDCDWNYLFWVKDALDLIKSKDKKETTAIICAENETVLQISHILNKKWIKAQVFLDDLWFRLRDSLELRHFLNLCLDEDSGKLNKENIWDKYNSIVWMYWENKNTETLKKIVKTIVDTNWFITPKIVEDFIIELRDESELIDDEHQLFVSTFHKAKGREFDNVIICFDPKSNTWTNNYMNQDHRDTVKRRIYVWMTRAKNNLIILWNAEENNYFKFLHTYSPVKKERVYDDVDTDEISVITWLADTFISFHDDKIEFEPRIGSEVKWKEFTNTKWEDVIDFIWEGKVIQKSSKNLVKFGLNKWLKKWYYIAWVKIFQKILYIPSNDTKEHLVYLFDISLKKIPQELNEIKQAREKVEVLEKKIEELSSVWTTTLEYQRAIKERDQQIEVLKKKTSVLEARLEKAEKGIQDREDTIKENNLNIITLQQSISSITEEKESVEFKINELELKLREARKKWNNKTIKEYESKLAEEQSKLSDTELKLSTITLEKEILEERNQQLVDENANLRKENEELSRKIEEAKQGNNEWNKWHIFKAGEGEKIKQFLIKQIKSAFKSVIIIDPYIDSYTFELLWNRRTWVRWSIMYEMKKTLYSLNGDRNALTELLKKRSDQEGNEINVRTVPNLHARFFIIDDDVWSIDYSMNSNIGSKVTTIQKLKNTKQEILDAYR